MFITLIRTIILYLLVMFIMRAMGKRQIGQLEPFELVITIMISELAALPMQDTKIPLAHGVIPAITLLFIQSVLALIQLKSEKIRGIINGKPSILIKNGKLDIKELKCNKFNINDLLEELRLNGYYNIEDIEYAILETSGQISIIPKTNLSNVTKEDLQIKTKQDKIPVTLILDGVIQKENLKLINKNEAWLQKQLQIKNIKYPKDVFFASLNSKGEFYYQLNQGKE